MTEKNKENEEVDEPKGTLLLSIVALPTGGFQIERNICPELLALLVLETEIAKHFLLAQHAGQVRRPEAIFQEDHSRGYGH